MQITWIPTAPGPLTTLGHKTTSNRDGRLVVQTKYGIFYLGRRIAKRMFAANDELPPSP
jgi:hypothetical protein